MRRRHARSLLVVVASRPPLLGVARRRRGRGVEPPTITLVTHDSFAVSKSVLRRVHEADRASR